MEIKTTPAAGATCQQYKGKTKIRLVKVLATTATTATVKALNGPLAGCEYNIPVTDLLAPEERA